DRQPEPEASTQRRPREHAVGMQSEIPVSKTGGAADKSNPAEDGIPPPYRAPRDRYRAGPAAPRRDGSGAGGVGEVCRETDQPSGCRVRAQRHDDGELDAEEHRGRLRAVAHHGTARALSPSPPPPPWPQP